MPSVFFPHSFSKQVHYFPSHSEPKLVVRPDSKPEPSMWGFSRARRKRRTTVLFNGERKGQTERPLLWPAVENVILKRARWRETQATGEKVAVSWFGVSLCLFLPAPSNLLSLCHTKAYWVPGWNLRQFHPILGPAMLKLQNTSLYSEISIDSPLLWQLWLLQYFTRENKYHPEVGRSSGWHLLPTEQETSLSSPKTATWQDKAEWNTKLIAPILPLSC